MIEKLKEYLIQIALQKYLPMAGLAAVTALGGLFAAHTGVLEQWGVTFHTWPFVWPVGQEPSGPCLLIELDTFNTAAIAGITALVAMILRATQHHVTGTNPDAKPEGAPPAGLI